MTADDPMLRIRQLEALAAGGVPLEPAGSGALNLPAAASTPSSIAPMTAAKVISQYDEGIARLVPSSTTAPTDNAPELPPAVQECIDAYGRYYADHHKLGMSVRKDMQYVAEMAMRWASPALALSEVGIKTIVQESGGDVGWAIREAIARSARVPKEGLNAEAAAALVRDLPKDEAT